jgi:ABC-type amino acid transport substrate-binding protein
MRTALILVILLLFIPAICQPVAAARDVRVALHELKPSLYTDEKGQPAGIFVDLIKDIAKDEGWNLIWVHGTLKENLDRLAAGQIDLVMAITDTSERRKLYDFNHEAAVASWAQVYTVSGSDINTILDLDGKRVAVLKGDVNNIAMRDYAKKFNINPDFTEYDTLDEVFSQTRAGNADAAVALRVAGQESAKKHGLSATPVMFFPSSLGFAVPKGKNPDLLTAIDRYLLREKNDPSSYYSQTMEKWLGEKAGWVIPPYVFLTLAAAVVIAILFVIMSLVLRREVRRKTAELSLQNEELRAANEQLVSTEEELRANYLELGRSEKALSQARKKLNVLNTLTFQEIQNGVFTLAGYLELAKEGGCSESAKTYIENGGSILRSVENSLRFAKLYQDMGMSEPKWQSVNYVFINAISHLDFSKISRIVDLDNIEIYADPLLENVLFQIMENVIRHGTGATEITLRYQENPDGLVILIEDNGPGIPAAEKERIFEKGSAGHGGGLFLAREILSITGISIRETGMDGSGARFEIFVPKGAYRFVPKDTA